MEVWIYHNTIFDLPLYVKLLLLLSAVRERLLAEVLKGGIWDRDGGIWDRNSGIRAILRADITCVVVYSIQW